MGGLLFKASQPLYRCKDYDKGCYSFSPLKTVFYYQHVLELFIFTRVFHPKCFLSPQTFYYLGMVFQRSVDVLFFHLPTAETKASAEDIYSQRNVEQGE